MKIVHAVYSLEMGGAEVIVSQLCRIQRASGHDVSIVAYSKLGVLGEALKADGFDIRILGVAHPLKTMLRYFRYFRQTKPDIVHCHNIAPTIQAAPPARLAGVPRIITTRHRLELPPFFVSQEPKYNFFCWFCDYVAGICGVTCDGIRAGKYARKDKVVLVYNGASPIHRNDTLAKRGFTLLFVGRLVPEKDLSTLIRAVAIARDSVPHLELWLVGSGAAREELEALTRELALEDCVRFQGQQTDTAPYFSAADAFVMSSISEGLPMSLLQSMSLGTPAILTDVDGMGEVLRLTGSGLLVPVGDPAAFAEAIVKLAEDPVLRSDLSHRAKEAYATRFTLEKMYEEYLRLYQA